MGLPKSLLAPVPLVVLLLALAILLLVQHGFPAFQSGLPAQLASPGEVDRALPFLLWEDRLLDILAQAALMLLAAVICVSAMRLWGERAWSR